MKTRQEAARGQSLVETAILLPLLLILLAGGWWAFQDLSLSGAVESAVHTHLLRSGRNLPSIAPELSKMIHPVDNTVRMASTNRSLVGAIPFFSGLSGNTAVSVGVSRQKEQIGGFIDMPDHDFRREAEAAVDCWGENSRSGSTIRSTVTTIVAVSALR